MLLNPQELVRLATRAAYQSEDRPAYLPDRQQDFVPHPWVLKAMQDAINENDLKRGLLNEHYAPLPQEEVGVTPEPVIPAVVKLGDAPVVGDAQ